MSSECVPWLATFAVPRTGSDDLPGRYSRGLDVWVIDGPTGELPMANSAASAGPVTKIDRERDAIAVASHLELVTKTRHEVERDDNSDPTLVLPELFTKTEVQRERDDAPNLSPEILGLVTKTLTRREGDDHPVGH